MTSLSFKKMLKVFHRRRAEHEDVLWCDLYTPGAFCSLIKKEQSRSDRLSSFFSLIVFECIDVPSEPILQSLIHIIRSRKRFIDEIGRIDKSQVGLLLPNTTVEGANTVADEVCRCARVDDTKVNIIIYGYPSDEHNQSMHPSKHADEHFGAGTGVKTRVGSLLSLENGSLYRITGTPLYKRLIDIGSSLLGIILLLPGFLIFAAFIKVVSPGPVFFKQQRIGYLGRPFWLWKLRTMKVNADSQVHKRHLKKLIHSSQYMEKLDDDGDPRIIFMGGWIRSLGLDELPQLINVLRGEMSLVGPRPCLPYELDEYQPWQLKRLEAMPGLTGLWQVNGKNKTTFTEMVRFDIRYHQHRGLMLDLKILLKTFPAVLVQFADMVSTKAK